MSTSATAADDLVALAVEIAEGASTGQMLWCAFEESSIARAEEVESCAVGITDEDVTSMFIVRKMLDCYLRSAAEHTRAAAVLMGSGGSAMSLLSIVALSRVSCEASGVAFWLSDPDLGWGDRLKRCNQLQFTMIEDALRGSKEYRKIISTSWIEKEIADYGDEMSRVIDVAKQQNWNHQDQPPSRSNWSRGIPSFTQLMRDLVQSSGEPAAVGQALYSSGSGVVHSNPILVTLALDELTPVAGQYAAALRIKTALRCYHLLVDRITKWTDWETESDWFEEAERISQVLLISYLNEMQSSPAPTDEFQHYRQHLSDAVGLLWDDNDDDTP